MTLLDEKIAALFRKSSPISAGAEPTPSVDRPIAEKAASEAVVSESAVEEANAKLQRQQIAEILGEMPLCFGIAGNQPLDVTAIEAEARSKGQMQRASTTNLRRLPKGLWQSKQAHYGRDWI